MQSVDMDLSCPDANGMHADRCRATLLLSYPVARRNIHDGHAQGDEDFEPNRRQDRASQPEDDFLHGHITVN